LIIDGFDPRTVGRNAYQRRRACWAWYGLPQASRSTATILVEDSIALERQQEEPVKGVKGRVFHFGKLSYFVFLAQEREITDK
jgi:hypothetical protein